MPISQQDFLSKYSDIAKQADDQTEAQAQDPAGFKAWREANSHLQEDPEALRTLHDQLTADQPNVDAAMVQPDDNLPAPSGAGAWVPPTGEPAKTEDLVHYKPWLDASREWYKSSAGRDFVGTDEALSSDALDRMSMFNWNIPSMAMAMTHIAAISDPVKQKQAALSFYNMMNIYDWSNGGADEFGRALRSVVSDPTTYVGLGVGSVAGHVVAKRAAVKALLEKIKSEAGQTVAETALKASAAGAVEGGAIGGASSTEKQKVGVAAGEQKEVDATKVVKDTAAGVAVGAGFGGIIGAGLAHGANTYAARLAKKADPELLKEIPGFDEHAAAANEPVNAPPPIVPKPNAPANPAKLPENMASDQVVRVRRVPTSATDARPVKVVNKVQFESDVDKALYIVSQPTRRTRTGVPDVKHAQQKDAYYNWLVEQGLKADDIGRSSARVAKTVDTMLKGSQPDATITLPRTVKAPTEFAPSTTETKRPPQPRLWSDVKNDPNATQQERLDSRAVERSRLRGVRARQESDVNSIVDGVWLEAGKPLHDENPLYSSASVKSRVAIDKRAASSDSAARYEELWGKVQGEVDAINERRQQSGLDPIDTKAFPARRRLEQLMLGVRKAGDPGVREADILTHRSQLKAQGELPLGKAPRNENIRLPVNSVVAGQIHDVVDKHWVLAGKPKRPTTAFESAIYPGTEQWDHYLEQQAAWNTMRENIVKEVADIKRMGVYNQNQVLHAINDRIDRLGLHDVPEAEVRYQAPPATGKLENVPGVPAEAVPAMETASALAEGADKLEGRPLVKNETPKKGDWVADSSTGEMAKVVGGSSKGGKFQVKYEDGTIDTLDAGDSGVHVMPRFFQDKPGVAGEGGVELSMFQDPDMRYLLDLVSKRSQNVKNTVDTSTFTKDQMIEMARLQSHWKNILGEDVSKTLAPADIIQLGVVLQKQKDKLLPMAQALKAKMEAGGRLTTEEMMAYRTADAAFEAGVNMMTGAEKRAKSIMDAFSSINDAIDRKDLFQAHSSMANMLSDAGGKTNIARKVMIMADVPDDLAQVARMHRATFMEKAGDFLMMWRYNSMLSSFRTAMSNLAGHVTTSTFENLVKWPIKIGLSNMESLFRDVLGIKPMNEMDRLTFSAWHSNFQGYQAATLDSMELAKRIISGKEIGEGRVWNELGLRYHHADVPTSTLGKAGTLPMRGLEAVDGFFKNQHYSAKMYELAERHARADVANEIASGVTKYDKEGKVVDVTRTKEQRMRYWLDNPSDAMMSEAHDWAQKLTFTSDPSIYGGLIGGMARALSKAQHAHPLIQAIIPFVRTPMNLIGYSLENTLAGQVIRPFDTLNAIRGSDPIARNNALTNVTIGAGVMMLTAEMYARGKLHGIGPQNQDEMRAREKIGAKRNSVMVASKYLELNRMDPAGAMLNIAATTWEMYSALQDMPDEARNGALTLGIVQLADMIVDRSALGSLNDALSIIRDPSLQNVSQFTGSVASSFINPGIARDVREMRSNVQGDTTAFTTWDATVKQFMNAWPGLSEKVPGKIDWAGDVVINDGNLMVRGLIPIRITDDKSDIDKPSAALANAQVPITKPDHLIPLGHNGEVKLNLMSLDGGQGFVYQKYQQFVGRERYALIQSFVQSPNFKLLGKPDVSGRDQLGPNSIGADTMSNLLGKGQEIGQTKFLDWLSKTKEMKLGDGRVIEIQHPFSYKQYEDLMRSTQERNQVFKDVADQYPGFSAKDRPIQNNFSAPRF